MYYELLQQRYAAGIDKQAGILDKGIKAIGRIGGRASTMATTGTAKKLKTGTSAVRKQLKNIKETYGPLDKNSQKFLNDFNRRRDAIAYKLGKKRLIGAGAVGGTGLAGYGAYNLLSGDAAGDSAASEQVQTPSLSDAQLMAQNGWNGWNWNDLGGSLANYISSGKIAEHAIPAILAYMAGRAMS